MMFARSLPTFPARRASYAGLSVITFSKTTVTTTTTPTMGG
jgi:hypothetical protein